MNEKELDILLSKYYRGETSLDEERLLRESLAGNDADALLMNALDQMESGVEVPSDLEANLSDMIDQWEEEEKQEAKVAPSMWRRSSWWAAAASVAVVAAVGLWFMHSNYKNPADNQPPIIAKTQTPPAVEETQQPEVVTPVPDVARDNSANENVGDKVQRKQPTQQKQLKPASAFINKAEHLAQAVPQPSSESELSPTDEEIALAALEKFSTVLNKGMDQLNDAGEKIDDINNTINQHLL
jgi:hypothetical protein